MKKTKEKYGQYFTRPEIAEFMVSLITHQPDTKVLEPSCGRGVFLDKLAQSGYVNVSAYEIDNSLANEYPNVKHSSFLSAPDNIKYDVVIGNPPYIRWKNLEPELREELENCSLWKKYFNSLCDYLFIFILKSIELLNESGELIFICSEYWLNTTHSVRLRDYMCMHGFITDIFHFKEAPLFEKVASSLIIFRYVKSSNAKRTCPDINFFLYTSHGMPTTKDLKTKSCFAHTLLPQFSIGQRWQLASCEKQQQCALLETACSYRGNDLFSKQIMRLGDVCEIGNGMVSGLDKAFKLADNAELNALEESCTINVLKAKQLKQYGHLETNRYIFMLNAEHSLSEEDFAKFFPYFFSQINPLRKELRARYCYNREIPIWDFVFPRNKALFDEKMAKIFVPCKERISHKKYFRFCQVESGIYPLQDVTCIVPHRECKESIDFIVAYLNCSYVFNWLCLNGIVKGEIVEFSQAPLASIPFRRINWESAEEITLHEKISHLSRELFLKQGNDEQTQSQLEHLMQELINHGN